jgi:hypothetical protein
MSTYVETIIAPGEQVIHVGRISLLVKAKGDAKVDRVAADTRQDAATKQADARKEANQDKSDAEYKVAIEKCDALAGPVKDSCVSAAKAQYGKS